MPYKAFKTSDGDILLGGGNDRLFGILAMKVGKPEWVIDERFKTNSKRVENRATLEGLIEDETQKRSTEEWLQLLEGCGMRESIRQTQVSVIDLQLAYAAINDIQTTLNHEHGMV